MDLNFKNTNTLYSTHGFHTYPAKMIPQIAKSLLDEFGKGAETMFDPFCGSGTSLVEANLHGIKAIGSDLNPLARLIAKVKTTPIELQSLDLHLKDFYNYLFQFRYGVKSKECSIVVPSFPNIDFWFSRNVKRDLSVISSYIGEIENKEIKDFFHVAFSQTIRECSWTRKNEFKLYKMSTKHIRTFKPDVFSTFEKTLGKNRNGLVEFMKKSFVPENAIIGEFDSSKYIPKKIVQDESIDIVLTSPPYGDSTTTVAYGQFSALANQWLGFMERGRSLDNDLMGGRKQSRLWSFSSPTLNDQIKQVEKVDRKRALDVVSFYKDYNSSIRNIASKIKRGGYSCYVISNRTVRGVQLKSDQITQEFFGEHGFSNVATYSREISNKRLPKRNSSTGKGGNKSNLMNKEYIVVMQKN